ncbi:MAG TPA: thioredoxin fold domain-containing protein [Thermoanaerobaculia bacterium]
MEAESYEDAEVASFIHENFVPLGAHIKEHPAWFHRFSAVWTPTILIMDPNGEERWRIEGYLPKNEFRAQLELGLARVDVMRKRWAEAEKRYANVVERYADTNAVPEALYWRDVSKYNQTHDHVPLQNVARELKERYPDSEWAVKASVWGG